MQKVLDLLFHWLLPQKKQPYMDDTVFSPAASLAFKVKSSRCLKSLLPLKTFRGTCCCRSNQSIDTSSGQSYMCVSVRAVLCCLSWFWWFRCAIIKVFCWEKSVCSSKTIDIYHRLNKKVKTAIIISHNNICFSFM